MSKSPIPIVLSSIILVVLNVAAAPATTRSSKPRPEVWMGPTASEDGKAMRELFGHPDQWQETRSLIDVLCYTDLNYNKQFKDDELRQWFAMLRQWNVKLGLEVGAVKPWGKTGERAFNVERPMWQRIQKLGGNIYAIAMDEPLCCARKEIHEPDDYAVRETAAYIALVRKNFPQVLIGDIEPYPFIPLADQMAWIEALQKRLAELGVRGLDFYRLDVNWAEFVVFDRGNWPEVKKLERYCRQRKIPFSLIYWASGYPGLKKRDLADDSTWYVSIMQQGYDYAMAQGAPDQVVIQSWIGAPARTVPETEEFTFTRSVRDFVKRFAK